VKTGREQRLRVGSRFDDCNQMQHNAGGKCDESGPKQRAGSADCDLKSVKKTYGIQRGSRAQPKHTRLVHEIPVYRGLHLRRFREPEIRNSSLTPESTEKQRAVLPHFRLGRTPLVVTIDIA
jgi:hypothetical protein